jgi:hypothetical protein
MPFEALRCRNVVSVVNMEVTASVWPGSVSAAYRAAEKGNKEKRHLNYTRNIILSRPPFISICPFNSGCGEARADVTTGKSKTEPKTPRIAFFISNSSDTSLMPCGTFPSIAADSTTSLYMPEKIGSRYKKPCAIAENGMASVAFQVKKSRIQNT